MFKYPGISGCKTAWGNRCRLYPQILRCFRPCHGGRCSLRTVCGCLYITSYLASAPLPFRSHALSLCLCRFPFISLVCIHMSFENIHIKHIFNGFYWRVSFLKDLSLLPYCQSRRPTHLRNPLLHAARTVSVPSPLILVAQSEGPFLVLTCLSSQKHRHGIVPSWAHPSQLPEPQHSTVLPTALSRQSPLPDLWTWPFPGMPPWSSLHSHTLDGSVPSWGFRRHLHGDGSDLHLPSQASFTLPESGI